MALLNRSIRFRLTVWYSAVLFGGQFVLGGLVWLLLWHGMHASLDEALLKRTKGLERYLTLEASDNLRNLPNEMEEFARSLPADYVLFVQDAKGGVLVTSGNLGGELPKSLPPLSSAGAFGNVKVRGEPYRSYGETYEENGQIYRVVLAGSISSVEATLHRLALLLFAAIPGVVVLAAAGGFWISGRALSPVQRMTDAATSIGFGNLSARLEVPTSSDEIQRLATTWNAMLQRIEDSAIRMNRFTADASHELRTPLSLIRATTDLALRRPRSADQYRESLAVIGLEAERMTRLVEDLLFLARSDADSEPRQATRFDLRTPTEAAAAEMLPKAAGRQIDLRLILPEVPVPFSGDEEDIRRLILALLDNAVKYSPSLQTVTVELKHAAEEIILIVQNAGNEIPPEARAHIFERFYRADASRHAESPSYGLGLSIAHAIAVHQKVAIRVDSKPGLTTFSVDFPAVGQHNEVLIIEATKSKGQVTV